MPERTNEDGLYPNFKTLSDGRTYRALKFFDTFNEADAYGGQVEALGLFEYIRILAEPQPRSIWVVWASPSDRYPELPPAHPAKSEP